MLDDFFTIYLFLSLRTLLYGIAYFIALVASSLLVGYTTGQLMMIISQFVQRRKATRLPFQPFHAMIAADMEGTGIAMNQQQFQDWEQHTTETTRHAWVIIRPRRHMKIERDTHAHRHQPPPVNLD